MIQKRVRTDLYDKFRQGAIPSGADFADLIRSQLNLLEDGIDVSDDTKEPICLRSHGENDNFLDLATGGGAKKWRIAGRCEDRTKEGLNITAEDQSKLYIERETGNVGINTDKPIAKLHIIQVSATDALRIDDEGTDLTPLVVNSIGKVGIGTGSPAAQLHLCYTGSGDILRVDDQDADDTPFIIDETGNVGIGYPAPITNLAVKGGVSIGTNNIEHEEGLYVAGDITVTGSVVFSGDEGIQFNAPITSGTTEITIIDNVTIKRDEHQAGSYGNLSVAGDTVLGTYSSDELNQKVVTINGKIQSGGDPESEDDQQYDLEINDALTINRQSLLVTVQGSFYVDGTSTLGNKLADNYIYLNGTVQRANGLPVTIDNDLSVTKKTSLYDLEVRNNLTVSKTSSLYDVTVGNNLTVSKTSSLYDVTVGNNLTVSKESNLNSAVINSLTLKSGATVNKISTDNTLSGKSDFAIPTEKAVKEYVDNLMKAIQIVYY